MKVLDNNNNKNSNSSDVDENNNENRLNRNMSDYKPSPNIASEHNNHSAIKSPSSHNIKEDDINQSLDYNHHKESNHSIEEIDLLDDDNSTTTTSYSITSKPNKKGYQKISSRESSPPIKSPPNSYQIISPKKDIEQSNPLNEDNPIENRSLLLQSYDEAYQVTIDDIENIDHRTPLSKFKLFTLTLSFLGVQFGWALQIAFSTPLFLELGVPPFWVSFIWMAGPISGLIVQPIVGVISDVSESKHGRRRPFIFYGSVFIVVGLLFISNAQSVGSIFGSSSKDISIFIAILGFWILDLSNNVVQAPCRALLVDVAPTSQQGIGSSLFSIMLGIGNLLGYFMGSLHLVKALPFMKTDIRALFTISMITLILCITLTLLTIKEVPYRKPNVFSVRVNPFQAILNGIKDMPTFLKRVCIVQFFSWIGWFCFVLYVTTWMGVNVYRGNPNAPEGSPERDLFQEGVRRGSLGLMVSSGVSICTSLLIPTLIRLVGIKLVYFIGNAIQTLLFALFFICHSKLMALLLIGATGIPWSVVMVLPFTIVGLGISSSESGLHMGTLNVFVVIPQLFVSLGISFIISVFGGDISYSLLTGAIASFLATIATIAIIVPIQAIDINIQ